MCTAVWNGGAENAVKKNDGPTSRGWKMTTIASWIGFWRFRSWRGLRGQNAVHVVCRGFNLAIQNVAMSSIFTISATFGWNVQGYALCVRNFAWNLPRCVIILSTLRWQSGLLELFLFACETCDTLLRLALAPPTRMTTPHKLWRHSELRQPHRWRQPQGAVLVPQVSRRWIAVTCAWSLRAPASRYAVWTCQVCDSCANTLSGMGSNCPVCWARTDMVLRLYSWT